MFRDPLYYLRDVSKAAGTLRVADVARTPTGLDMGTHALHSVRPARLFDFGSDIGFILPEAVADHPSSRRFLLPDRNPTIGGRKRPVRGIEVHDVARGVWAEAMFSGFESLKRSLGE